MKWEDLDRKAKAMADSAVLRPPEVACEEAEILAYAIDNLDSIQGFPLYLEFEAREDNGEFLISYLDALIQKGVIKVEVPDDDETL